MRQRLEGPSCAHDEAGIAVFLITHDLDALPSLGCSVMRLEEGVIEDGTGAAAGAASLEDGASTVTVLVAGYGFTPASMSA